MTDQHRWRAPAQPQLSPTLSTSVIERALRGVRLTLVLIFIAAVALRWRGLGLTAWGNDVKLLAIVGVLAVLAINIASITADRRPQQLPLSLSVAQVLSDVGLALAVMFALDAATTPLAWIALCLPTVAGSVRFGMIGAAVTWIGASITYVLLRLGLGTGPAVDTFDTLYLSFQQLIAVLLVAVPALYLADHWTRQVRRSHEARAEAERRAEQLHQLADSARRMNGENEQDIMREMVECSLRIGFASAEACRIRDDGQWHIVNTASGERPLMATGVLLPDVAATREPVLVDQSGTDEQRQMLHDVGFQSVVAVPVSERCDVILRAWSDEPELRADGSVTVLQALAAQTKAALMNAWEYNKLRTQSQQFAYQANHDALTGLPNRLRLVATVDEWLRQFDPLRETISLLFLDLDGFKAANDTHGHEAGDLVLKVISERLRAITPQTAMAARLGGDEFVVLHLGGPGGQAPTDFAEQVCTTVRQPIGLGSGEVANLRASVGISVMEPGMNRDGLLDGADAAMYEAKRAGGDRYVISPPLSGERRSTLVA